MSRRRRFSGELKAKIALEALRGDRTLQEIASKSKGGIRTIVSNLQLLCSGCNQQGLGEMAEWRAEHEIHAEA